MIIVERWLRLGGCRWHLSHADGVVGARETGEVEELMVDVTAGSREDAR